MMAKVWYPVIDIVSCIECGTCVGFCPHGVYDKSKAPVPMVVNPEACIDHCHACGNKCPVGAIQYLGEDTDWIPPVLRTEERKPETVSGCCCCGGGKNGK